MSHDLREKKSIRGDLSADADGRFTNTLLCIIIGLMVGAMIRTSTGKVNIDFSKLAIDAMSAVQSFMRWQVDNWFITIPIALILVIVWVKYGYMFHHFFRMGGY